MVGIARRAGVVRIAVVIVIGVVAALAGACETRAPAVQNGPVGASVGASGRVALPDPAQRHPALEFQGATAWLNVDRPLTSDDLRGRVVVVDFWTSCCINCLQTLPVLAAIEQRFAHDPVVVVGVHTPKFDAETERDRLSAILAQYSIAHPIALDGSQAIWNRWQVSGWPSLFVLDAQGRVVWRRSGEPDERELAAVISAALSEGAAAGALRREPIAGIHPQGAATGPLAFPGKVIALSSGGLAVSDTAHHRIVLVSATGSVDAVIGSGLAGRVDGELAEASFRKPQGLAEAPGGLYVADTENHAIRFVDLRARTVTTVAGTGELGHGRLDGVQPARSVALRSPWDVAFVAGAAGPRLYIAVAGSHQIAVYDPAAATLAPFAGDGYEQRHDGIAPAASFAQPSGLASDGSELYVADSETSSIRAIDLRTAVVRTIVGRDLFVFGDQDGVGDAVRLKHPLGIAWGEHALWVADTYNSKIKRIDPRTGETRTVAGGADRRDLFEPSGLFVRQGAIVVADTDHHRLVRVPVSGGPVEEVRLAGLAPPAVGVAVARSEPGAVRRPRIAIGGAALGGHAATTVHLVWQLPDGTGINDEAPFRMRWKQFDGLTRKPDDLARLGRDVLRGFDIELTAAADATQARLVGDLDVVVCDIATHRVCMPLQRELAIELRLGPASTASTVSTVSLAVPLPQAR